MPRQERERRFVAEYMLATFPDGDWELNVPLELIAQEGLTRAARLYR